MQRYVSNPDLDNRTPVLRLHIWAPERKVFTRLHARIE